MSDENKSADQSTDPELDKLLNSALADFDKLSQPTVKKEDASVTSTSEADEKSAEVVADETWTQDFIKQTAEQFEKNIQGLLQNGGGGDFEDSFKKMAQTVASAISGSESTGSGNGTEFQAAIAQALKDISATSENLQNDSSGITEADLAAVFSGASLEESGGDILPFMQDMMQSLLSKEILYPSLKELVEKYPTWLDEKKDSLPAKDLERFNKQFELMQEVCKELEMEKDDDADDIKKKRFDKILTLMHNMQSCGQPPEELVGDQTGLFQIDNEGNPTLPPGVDPQNCNIM